jgi:tripartite-type tricarboxylate transporter receptor subunit TctC
VNTQAIRLLAGLALLVAGAAQAQAPAPWPNRPIHIVITFPPGGSVDVVPRIVTQRLAERLGQPFVVDNKPGAGGQIAVDAVLKAPADGYTFLVGPTGTMAVNPALYRQINYDPIRDFQPVSSLARAPMVLMVQASRTGGVRELIAEAKSHPGSIHYGHGGNGTSMHLTGEMFNAATGAGLVPVPFRTSGAVITTIAGGQLEAGWVDTNFALVGLRGGRVRAIALAGRERTPMLPDVPTVAESGYPGFEAVGWFGFYAATGTPPEAIARLASETRAVLALPEVRERILATGSEPWGLTPDEFGAFTRAELSKWTRVVHESGARAD